MLVLGFAGSDGPSVSVQSRGKPIKPSTHSGLSAAPRVAPVSPGSPGDFRSDCDGPPCAYFTRRGLSPSLRVGVVQFAVVCDLIAECSVSALPRWLPESNSARGVGQFTAVARFIPCSPRSCEGDGFVCRFSLSLARGVGQQKDAFASVRRSNVGCAETIPLRIVPERGQVTEHFGEVPSAARRHEPRHVLHEDEARSKQINDPSILAPERRALAAESCSLSGEGYVLAGESPADHIDGGEFASDGAHVVISNSVGPVLREHGAAERLSFDLPNNATSRGVLDAQLQSTNPREQRPDPHNHPRTIPTSLAVTCSRGSVVATAGHP